MPGNDNRKEWFRAKETRFFKMEAEMQNFYPVFR
jgi:hypothetical protein